MLPKSHEHFEAVMARIPGGEGDDFVPIPPDDAVGLATLFALCLRGRFLDTKNLYKTTP